MARLLRRAHLDRGEAAECVALHGLRSQRLAADAQRLGGHREQSRARRPVVRQPARAHAERRGAGVDELIERIVAAAAAYPYADTYRVWPGPNSNTFTAFVLRSSGGMRVDLPSTAIGKDYLGAALAAQTPSGRGWQVSLFGLLGVLVGAEEGVEVDVLGLTFGIDVAPPSLKLPLAGRVGLSGLSY
jgi:hypothetical protein